MHSLDIHTEKEKLFRYKIDKTDGTEGLARPAVVDIMEPARHAEDAIDRCFCVFMSDELTRHVLAERLRMDTPLPFRKKRMVVLPIVKNVVFEILELIGIAHELTDRQDTLPLLGRSLEILRLLRESCEGDFVVVFHREEDRGIGIADIHEDFIPLISMLKLQVIK